MARLIGAVVFAAIVSLAEVRGADDFISYCESDELSEAERVTLRILGNQARGHDCLKIADYMRYKTNFRTQSTTLTDLRALSFFPAIETMDLRSKAPLKLEQLTNKGLVMLKVSSPISVLPLGATNLQRLVVADCPDLDITGIGKFVQLQEFVIVRSHFSDYSPLKKAHGLRHFGIHYSTVRELDVSVLPKKLEWLSLDGNPLKSFDFLAPLADRKELKHLSLGETGMANIDVLSKFVYLDDLNLYGNAIADVSPLAGLWRLNKIGLDANPLGTTIPKSPTNCPTNSEAWVINEWCAQAP